MGLKSFVYSLKVWVSTILLGGVIFIACLYNFTTIRPGYLNWELVGFTLLFSLVGSIPALLLFWWGSFYLFKTPLSAIQKRVWIAAMAFALTCLSIFIILMKLVGNEMGLVWMTVWSYYAVMAGGIFLYRVPEAEAGSEAEAEPDVESGRS